MSDFGTMVERIANEIARPEVVARIPDEIRSSIAFYRNERLFFKEAESTTNTAAGQQNYAVPQDYMEPDYLTYIADTDIRYTIVQVSWTWMRQQQRYTRTQTRPRQWAYYRNEIWLWPIPDQTYPMILSFLKELPPLVNMTDTNDWMTEGEELIRSRTMINLLSLPALIETVGKALPAWEAREQEALRRLRQQSAQKMQDRTLQLDDTLRRRYGGRYNIFYQ